jgi:hypothetical protein
MKNEMQDSILKEKLDSRVHVKKLRQVVNQEPSNKEIMASLPLPANKVNIALNHLIADHPEEEGTIEWLRKSYEETMIFKRLTRVEGQLRRLTIYGSIFCLITAALLIGSIMFSISLTKENIALHGNKSMQTVRQIIPSQPIEKGSPSVNSAAQPRESSTGKPKTSPEASTPDKKTVPALADAHSAVTDPSKETPPSSAAQKTSVLPIGQEAGVVPNTSKEPTVPGVTYVGSITSNKYHYPDCKWAKTIIPRKVRGFHSVAEAQKAGYILCQTCLPPLTDEPQTSAR